MFSFCPNCGQTLEQDQVEGQALTCIHCGKPIGTVTTPKPIVIDPVAEWIRAGTVARCPICQQAVELKTANARKTLVPHYAAGQKKICPGSGKPVSQ